MNQDIHSRKLKFHWRLPLNGESSNLDYKSDRSIAGIPNFEQNLDFCRLAEASGIDSLLTAFSYFMPDPVPLITALGMATDKIRFMLAYRPGLLSPTLFVQQVNTISALIGGRLCLNIVVGHSVKEQAYYGDYLSKHERYIRAEEFLHICNALWKSKIPVDFKGKYYNVKSAVLGTPFYPISSNGPDIFLSGSSQDSEYLATREASCWLQLGGMNPDEMKMKITKSLDLGIESGLRFSIIARETRKEALQAAQLLLSGGNKDWTSKNYSKNGDSESMNSLFEKSNDDSNHWVGKTIWTGAVASYGVSAVALVGSYEEIINELLAFKKIGVSNFIFSGWPNKEALQNFGENILPELRKKENQLTKIQE